MNLWNARTESPFPFFRILGGLMVVILAGALAVLWVRLPGGSRASSGHFVQSAAASGRGVAVVWLARVPRRGNLLIAAATASEPAALRAPEGWEAVADEGVGLPPLAVFSRIASGGERDLSFLADRGVPMTVQVYEYAGIDAVDPFDRVWIGAPFASADAPSILSSDGAVFGAYAADPAARAELAGVEGRAWSRTYGGGSVSLQAFERAEGEAGAAAEVRFARSADARVVLLALRRTGEVVAGATESLPTVRIGFEAAASTVRIGAAAEFVLTVVNDGRVPATDLVLEMPGSPWRFAGAEPAEGTTLQPFAREWRIPSLAAGETATLRISLVPERGEAGAAALPTVSLRTYAQAPSLEDLPSAAAQVMLAAPLAESSCPALGEPAVEAVRTESGVLEATATADGAVFALVGSSVDRSAAVFVAPGAPLSVAGDPERVYAWLGNACRMSFIVFTEAPPKAEGEAQTETASSACALPLPPVTQALAPGDAGAAVADLHRLLSCIGYLEGDPSARFSVQTEASVKAFQTAHGLAPVGLVGPATRILLNAYRDLLQ